MQITFSQEQLAVLDKAIQQLPYYLAAPLISHINAEIAKQKLPDAVEETSLVAKEPKND